MLHRDGVTAGHPGIPGDQLARFREAFGQVHREISLSAADDDIFAAHLEMMDDPMLTESVEEAISSGMDAETAVRHACDGICAMFAGIDDEYLKARVDDVRDICMQIGRALAGTLDNNPFASLPHESVIVADELFPSDTALMDFSLISGFVTARGSSTSHVCIIARSKGIPVLVGQDISGIRTGDWLELETPEDSAVTVEHPLAAFPAVRLYANAASVDDIRTAIAAGADGIGLFRTEFMFMHSSGFPSVEEQAAVYRSALLACGDKPLTIRTLDIGGDKPLPYMPARREDNPFLGLRGVRFALANPDIMADQLSALVRAACDVPEGRLRIMFPMISTVDELERCKAMLDEAVATCGHSVPRIEVGIMIETPAAVLCARELAERCDFFSIGTNDLTQYVMAADRGNDRVSYLYNPLGPAVCKAVSMTVAAAQGKPVGVCGEVASDPAAAETLCRLGVNSLSVAVPRIESFR